VAASDRECLANPAGRGPCVARPLVTLSMRTPGTEVFRGRWGRSLSAGSLSEAFAADGVAVLLCCTALGLFCVASRSWASTLRFVMSQDPSEGHDYLAREARARVEIDKQLAAAGWVVQSQKTLNLSAGPGVAVREFTPEKPHGRVN
jgi:hypothetical protein